MIYGMDKTIREGEVEASISLRKAKTITKMD